MIQQSPRIVHLTSVHSVRDTRILRECVTLARAGLDVSLIGRNDCDEVIDGVRIYGIPAPRGRFERMTSTVFRVFRKARELNAEIYHFHDPELLPVGLLLEQLGRRVIYDVHEDVPRQILGKEYVPLLARKTLARSVERFTQATVHRLSGVVCAWPNIAETFDHRHKVLVQNYPDRDEYATVNRAPFANRPNHIVYCGSISESRGLIEMLRAMELVRIPGAKLIIAGRFFSDDVRRIFERECNPERVEFVGWVDRGRIRALLADARAALAVLQPLPNYLETMPTKLFEYMSAAVPVVISNFTRWRAVVDEAQCGIPVDPRDPRAIAEALEELLLDPHGGQAMGERGAHAARERYNWQTEAERLLQFYAKLGATVSPCEPLVSAGVRA